MIDHTGHERNPLLVPCLFIAMTCGHLEQPIPQLFADIGRNHLPEDAEPPDAEVLLVPMKIIHCSN